MATAMETGMDLEMDMRIRVPMDNEMYPTTTATLKEQDGILMINVDDKEGIIVIIMFMNNEVIIWYLFVATIITIKIIDAAITKEEMSTPTTLGVILEEMNMSIGILMQVLIIRISMDIMNWSKALRTSMEMEMEITIATTIVIICDVLSCNRTLPIVIEMTMSMVMAMAIATSTEMAMAMATIKIMVGVQTIEIMSVVDPKTTRIKEEDRITEYPDRSILNGLGILGIPTQGDLAMKTVQLQYPLSFARTHRLLSPREGLL